MATQEQILASLENTATLLQKAQINLKKCPKARLTKGYIESRMKIIDDYWDYFKDAHQQLVRITPKEQKGTLPYFLNEEFYIYEVLYSVLQGDLRDMLSAIEQATTVSSANLNLTQSTQNDQIRLPRIQLPIFSGSYDEWPSFQDLFTALVHNNTALSDVQKLHYLKTSVAAEAESLLKHIQVTSNNYTQAWNILKTRYGNQRLIINHNLMRLFNQRKLTNQSAAQLKSLLDTTTQCLHNLENVNIPTCSWDPIIIFLLVQKLDSETHKSWEEHAYKTDSEPLPTWSDFKKFLEAKFRTLELISTSTKELNRTINTRSHHVAIPTAEKSCVMCKENHTICHCKEFTQMEPYDRGEYAKNKNLCFNCLVPGHSAIKCRVPVSCRICQRRHHSLLHQSTKQPESTDLPSTSQPLASAQLVTEEEEEEEIQANTVIASHFTTRQGVALLATAIVEATSSDGRIIPLRALIDQGSQATFISEKATQLLKLERQSIKGNVMGVGSTKVEIKHMVHLRIKSHSDPTFTLPIQAYVMSKQLTTKMPIKEIVKQPWPHLDGLVPADDTCFTSGPVDLLLGVREYARIVQEDLIKGPPGAPCAQKTHLGWILFEDVCANPQEDTFVVMHHQIDIEDMLKSIWEIDTDGKRHLTKEEQLCEEIYEKTVIRSNEGRYIVKLPFKIEKPESPKGNLKEIALQRFIQLEKKFKRSPNLKTEYTKVINDYIDEGHMEVVPAREKEKDAVYLPHHAVIREDKESTRTRVVFDASCKGSNNVSLNDELLVGPQLKDDLRFLLMRWRMKGVCFMADIKQMYRQVLVSKEDADFQRLFGGRIKTKNLKNIDF